MLSKVRIGTRTSTLALWQANWVKNQLEELWQGLEVELVPVKTSGDKIQDISLSRIGGKGLFVKEIEEALVVGRVDLAVHSVKDLPADLPEGLMLSAVPAREDPRDVLVSLHAATINTLPPGARVGTSSLRRQALLLHLRPDVRVELLRGNVDTRLKKLEAGVVDATILAAAGLKRLGLMSEQGHVLDETLFLPAIGQGALGIETRRGDETRELVMPLHDQRTGWAIEAERVFLKAVGGSCKTPLAGRAKVSASGLELSALIATPDGKTVLRGTETGRVEETVQVGNTLADRLLSRGGREILGGLENHGW